MKKAETVLFAVFLFLLLPGCGSRVDYTLPDDPIVFNTATFVNPNDPEDRYQSITYGGRTYIGYGSNRLPDKNVGACLGYLVQDGEKYENTRICLLSDDPDANYLVSIEVKGFMDMPIFYRATDTVGQTIPTPKYIKSHEFEFWEGSVSLTLASGESGAD